MSPWIQEPQPDGSVTAKWVGQRQSVIGASGIEKFYSKKRVRTISRRSKKSNRPF